MKTVYTAEEVLAAVDGSPAAWHPDFMKEHK